MGWSRGSEVGDEIWFGIREYVPKEHREKVARVIIDALEAQDCDTIYECEQLVKDAKLEDEYFGEE